jgi:CelD/BcsL family acetyltransferase involved in cellulose biosynthesis
MSAMMAADVLLAFEALPELWATLAATVRRTCREAVHSGAHALEEAAPAWHALEAEGGAATAFQTFAVAQACAAAHIAQGGVPRIVTVQENGRPMVLLPTVVARLAGVSAIRFLGDPFIQYGDALVSPHARPHHLAAAFRAAADPSVASLMYLRKVREDARLAPVLAAQALVTAEQAAPLVDLGDVRKPCRDTQRSTKRLAQEGDISLEVARCAGVADVRESLALKREWLAASGLTSSVIGHGVWEDVLVRLAERRERSLTVARLTAGGEVAATEIALVHDGVWHSYLGAVAPRFARCGPGKVQIAQTIAHCRQQGLAAYDLLAPSQPYKEALATRAIPVRDYALPLDALGRVALLALRSAPEIRAGVERLPPVLRRAVRGLARL